jgi:hypothetical protein
MVQSFTRYVYPQHLHKAILTPTKGDVVAANPDIEHPRVAGACRDARPDTNLQRGKPGSNDFNTIAAFQDFAPSIE